jgi:hypothetical protein
MTSSLTTISENSLSNLPEELQLKILAAAKKIQESSSISINKIRLDAKSYIFPDQNEVQTFQGIIIATKHANIHYQNDYEEGVPNPVDCMAIGDEACKDLTPHEKVENPIGTKCATCKNFQWGSGSRGKGKSCGEHTLLAVYVPSYGDDIFLLEEKKKNSVIVDSYLKTTTKKHGHPMAVVTQFTMGDTTKWEQSFSAVAPANVELVTNLTSRMDEAEDMLISRVVDVYQKNDIPFGNEEENTVRTARSR